MKKIEITPEILRIAEEYCDDILAKYGNDIKDDLKSLKKNIIDCNYEHFSLYVFYINLILCNLKDIILMKPLQFAEPLLGVLDFSDVIDFKTTKYKAEEPRAVNFARAIVAALHYESIRSNIIPSYVKKLGIRACVYCNANWAITFQKNKTGSKKGYYEMDHFKPKSAYPHLCISFFNLQPSCGGCNKTKSTNTSLFNLYDESSDKLRLNPFLFEIDKASLARYYMNHSSDLIRILFNGKQGNDTLVNNHNETFHIENLYREFTPEVEELIWKFKVYNDAYVDTLIQSFKKLFPGEQKDIYRLLYGFYKSEEDIHKRPLTKLFQDIYTQLSNLQK